MKIVSLLIIALVVLETAAIAQPSAEDLYTEGQAAYDHADYTTAITKWQASYDLSKEAGLHFNLAQAKRLAGNCTEAIATYRRFLASDQDPTSEQHALANDFVRELEGTCLQEEPVIALQPQIHPVVVRTRSGERPWKVTGLVTGGVGVVTIAIGLGLGHHGASIGDEITAACATSCDWASLQDKDARGRRQVTIGKVLDVAGVAAVASGAVFYYLGMRQDETIAITPTPGGGAVSWNGTW